MPWSPEEYLKYETERTRPSRDLLQHVPLNHPKLIVDLGCGPGNSTQLLAERYPEAELLGVDSSAEMLEAARQRLPEARFIHADIVKWTPTDSIDLIFANAVFQWVPDHLAVLERLLSALHSGSVLAIQVPDNLAEPSHALMRTLASKKSRRKLITEPVKREVIPSPSEYYNRLKPLCRNLELWRTCYQHPLKEAADIVEMVKSTGLRPYLQQLPAEERQPFLVEYEGEIAKAYPPLFDGSVMFRFPRFFLVAQR